MAKKTENTGTANNEEAKTSLASTKEKTACSAGCGSFYKIILALIVAILGGLIWQNVSLTSRLKSLEQIVANGNQQHIEDFVMRMANFEQNMTTLENKIAQNADDNIKMADNNRKIYVFNMDETVKNIGLQEANQKFEDDINDLDAQVKEAQATLKDLKEKEMKEKLLNLTIKPLQMKRDDLVQAYSKSVQDSLAQINNALAEIATESNISVIFMNKSVAVNTNYVIDITPQVVEKIKAKQQ